MPLLYSALIGVGAVSFGSYMLQPWWKRRALLNRRIKSLRLYARLEQERQ
jgi:hypothetical protein